MGVSQVGYSLEQHLVEDFCAVLQTRNTPWGEVTLTREFGFTRGRADVIAVDTDGNVLAFEAKLEKWRVALQQAYRNTCFANFSVILFLSSSSKK